MFSKQLIHYAQEKYEERRELLGWMKEQVESRMETCQPDEQILMKFLYGTMPLRDAGEYEFDVFLSYVAHSLMLRKTMAWCKDISEDMFLHHVLYYRINSENIEDCRWFFYDCLIDRIKGLSVKEAVLEINYWCAEQATYEASDDRTISPMTVYKSGAGRCGEESVFAVTAFRSVGIPARQVYTPRWAHCDDNHAWVEVYVDGQWCFLGACEPEEVLNKGWFTHASSRALLIHTRQFSDYAVNQEEEPIGRDKLLTYYNHTSAYALTRNFTVTVVDDRGQPMKDVTVFVEILNMAEYCSVATLVTNEEGKVSLTLGLGDVHIHAVKDRVYTETIAPVRRSSQVTLAFPSKGTQPEEIDWIKEIEIESPEDYPMHPVDLTREQKAANACKMKKADKLRKSRMESYYREELAAAYPGEKEILDRAKGNFDEIYHFLSKDENPNRKRLLHTLGTKDYKDAKGVVLEDHLTYAQPYAWMDAGLYEDYVLCPRIYLEEMVPYRSFITGYFDEQVRTGFFEKPESIWHYVQEHITFYPELDYASICSTPIGCLKLGQGSPISKKLLFVAICRTLGIPARINKVNLEAEYYDGQKFVPVSCETGSGVQKEMGRLKLWTEDGGQWKYYQTWTIGRLQDGRFVTLDYTDLKFKDHILELELEPGIYRIMTSSRMPSGNQHATERTFSLAGKQVKEVIMALREGDIQDMLVSYELGEFELMDQTGLPVSMMELLQNRTSILAFLEEGKEPTEHVLNEMLDLQEELKQLEAQIIFVVRNRESLTNATLRKVCQGIPSIQIFYDEMADSAAALARRVYTDPEKMPLLAVINPEMKCIYRSSGYCVGSVGLVTKILH